jgi:hypothetical protein
MTRRLVPLIGVLLAGALLGAVVTSYLRADVTVVDLPVARPSSVGRAPVPVPRTGVLLVWVPHGLPPGLVEHLRTAGFGNLTVVAGDIVQFTASWDDDGTPVDDLASGYSIPFCG